MNRAEKRRQQKFAQKQRGPAAPVGNVMQALDRAVQHHSAGKLQQAEVLYNQVLQADPNQPVALHLLGVLACQVGRSDVAVDLIGKAIAVQPDYAEAHSNLGIALKDEGRFDDAIASCQKALALNPNFPDAYNNLGNAQRELALWDDATASFGKALALRPDYVEAHVNLGIILQEQGQFEQAVDSFQKAIALNDDVPEAHNNMGNALKALGRVDEALVSYQKALALNPDFAEAYHNAADAYQVLGRVSDAVFSHRRAIALQPDNDAYWNAFAGCIDGQTFTSTDAAFTKDILGLLDRPTVRPVQATQAVISVCRLDESFSALLNQDRAATLDYADQAKRLSGLALLLRFMELSPISDLGVEGVLTALRRAMIAQVDTGPGDDGLAFSAAMAMHCFINEYVFSETKAETAAVEALQQRLADLVASGAEIAPDLVAALGAYRPLYHYDWAAELADRAWPEPVAKVVARQIAEPLSERASRVNFVQLTPIDNQVSQDVREQYEENPYPRWVKTGLHITPKSISDVLEGYLPSPQLEAMKAVQNPEILIAGCGTGRQVVESVSRFKDANFLAVDLSLSSLAYAQRKSEALGFPNVEFAQGDINALGNIGRTFDVIESVGVLHHLGNPLAGWRVLTDLLRPDGAMLIALYSETARRGVVQARDLIAEQGYSASPQDIRRCREDIIARTGDAHLIKLLDSYDFYSLSECRDLMFHVQEHRFTLPQINDALKDLGLEFLGFELPSARTLAAFKEAYPDAGSITSLADWHAFEQDNTDTFVGMYHFWCRKLG